MMNARTLFTGVILSILVLMSSTPLAATTYYVSPDGNDNDTGTSWETAVKTIQKGINKSSNGDTVLVADGTYTGTGNRDIDYNGKAIIVQSENGPEDCIIDCNGTATENHRGFYFHTGETNNSILKGFKIINGYKSYNYPQDGGAICCYYSSPKISNCIFKNNESYAGGGICTYVTNAIIQNCVFYKNSSHAGGAISQMGCTATACLNIINCSIIDNKCSSAIQCLASTKISNCIFWNNYDYYNEHISARQIFMQTNGSFATVVDIEHCDLEGGQNGIYVGSGTLNWGQGNIDADPCFISPDDYHISPFSPCINVGDPSGNYTGQVDINGEPRVQGLRVDIGADERAFEWRVKADATGANTGLTWEDAFTSIQDGIDAAYERDWVIVAEGIYNENLTFYVPPFGKNITVCSTEPGNWDVVRSTVIHGSGDTNTVVMGMGANYCCISGFTITGGKNGVHSWSTNSGNIKNCIITGNSDKGIFIESPGNIKNCIIHDNGGFGIFGATEFVIKDSLIYDNNGGVSVGSGTYADFSNCTIAKNDTYGIKAQPPYAVTTVRNCILWGNDDDLYNCSGICEGPFDYNDPNTFNNPCLNSCSATYSCIEDSFDTNDPNFVGSINTDPCFVDIYNDDFHLGSYSPCINTGDPCSVCTFEKDIDNCPRINGDYVDIGADEAYPIIAVEPNSISLSVMQGNNTESNFVITNIGGGSNLEFNINTRITEEISPEEGILAFAQGGSQLELAAAATADLSEEKSSNNLKRKSVSAVKTKNDKIIVEYSFDSPVLSKDKDAEYDILNIKGLESYERQGEPVIPVRPAEILLPRGKIMKNIKAVALESYKLGGTYKLRPGRKPVPWDNLNESEESPEPNQLIYSKTTQWPGKYYSKPIIQSKRGYQIMYLGLHPVQYVPATGEVYYVTKLQLEIRLTDSKKKGVVRSSKNIEKTLSASIDNPDAVKTYDLSQDLEKSGGGVMLNSVTESLGEGSYEYVVITNEYLKNTPRPWNFQTLCEDKERQGISATIVTTEWIYENYDGTRPDGQSDNQTKIRNFLIDAYQNWGCQYVLLAGDKDIIPIRYFWGYIDYFKMQLSIPADLYYGCVEPNECTFDYDADGIYGESTDGVDGGEADLSAEIFVGRALVENQKEVADFLKKNLFYASDSLRRDYQPLVSMVGEDWNGAWSAMGDLEPTQLGTDETTGFENHQQSDFYDFNTSVNLYEYPGYVWEVNDWIDLMNAGTHIFNHMSHSGAQSMGKLYIDSLDDLINEDYFFVYSMGCHPGDFSYKYYGAPCIYRNDCIAGVMTTMEHGAFATIANSVYGLSYIGPRFNQNFWDEVLGEQCILEIGKALQKSKEDNLLDIGYVGTRQIYYCLTLFGDPQQKFRFKDECPWIDAEPNEGVISPQDYNEINISINSEKLEPGTYQANITIKSNDPLRPDIKMPVTLTVEPEVLSIMPIEELQIEVFVGGPFSTSIYSLSNDSNSTISWTAECSGNWLDITPGSGTIPANGSTNVSVLANSNANLLSSGSYENTITFTNNSSGFSQKRWIDLNVYVDYLTEVFESDDVDIHNSTLTFCPNSPDSYILCSQNASGFPVDPNGGVPVTTYKEWGDYIWAKIDISGGKHFSFYGNDYGSVYVTANGSVVFAPGLDAWNVDIPGYFSTPRISALYSFLAPWEGGTISYKQLSDRLVLTFEDVPEWKDYPEDPNRLNSFQVELFFEGKIRITYLDLDLYWPSQGCPAIVGLSRGGGVPDPFAESDLSSYALCPGTIPGDITGDGKVDLDDLKILAEQWLQSPGTPSADIAPSPLDDIVNFLDFALMAENWMK
jgi:hypothetical protein